MAYAQCLVSACGEMDVMRLRHRLVRKLAHVLIEVLEGASVEGVGLCATAVCSDVKPNIVGHDLIP